MHFSTFIPESFEGTCRYFINSILFVHLVENGGSKQADRNGIRHKSNANAVPAEAELPRLTGTKSQVRLLRDC